MYFASDELSMSVLAFGYVLCLDGLAPLTRPPWRRLTLGGAGLFGVLAWAWYLGNGNHDVFAALFTCQVSDCFRCEDSSVRAASGKLTNTRRLTHPSRWVD
jgi:hypothetical protein